MKNLKNILLESVNIDFDEFCYDLEDKAYDLGERGGGVSTNVIYLKNIFGSDTISCMSCGQYGSGQIIRPSTQEKAEFIYIDRSSKKCVGVKCKKFGFMYIYNIGDLKKCFGEKNLNEIYKFIKR